MRKITHRASASSDPAMAPGVIVFSHGNSFPAGTYAQLFAHWRAAGWRVEAVEKYGHDPRYPVTSNWPRLRDQLIDFVDGLALDGRWCSSGIRSAVF